MSVVCKKMEEVIGSFTKDVWRRIGSEDHFSFKHAHVTVCKSRVQVSLKKTTLLSKREPDWKIASETVTVLEGDPRVVCVTRPQIGSQQV